MKENLSIKILLERNKEYSPSVQKESELLEIMVQTRCSKKVCRSLSFERAVVSVWHLVQQTLRARHFRNDKPAAFHLHPCKKREKTSRKNYSLQQRSDVFYTCCRYWVSTWNYWSQRGKEASDRLPFSKAPIHRVQAHELCWLHPVIMGAERFGHHLDVRVLPE